MATYIELVGVCDSATFLNRVQFACIVAAETIRTEATSTPNHAERLAWAKQALADPLTTAKRMSWAVLAQNRSLSLAQINAATDAALQAGVDAAVNLFAV
jgi:hypothetical protein